MSYQGGVRFEQGTGNLVVPTGKKITVESGGAIESGGDAFTSATFDSDYFELNDGEVTLKAGVVALLDIIDNIPTVDPADDGVTIWLDNSTLKVSGPSGG